MESFADRFVEALQINEWSNQDFCKMSGVDKTTVSLWRNGHRVPKRNRVFRIAKVLDVDPYWLLDGESNTHSLLHRLIDRLDEDQAKELINQILKDSKYRTVPPRLFPAKLCQNDVNSDR